MFIGQKEILSIMDQGDNTLKVSFVSEEPNAIIHKDLFDIIKSEEKGDGNVTDAIVFYLSKKFLAEMAQYDLQFYILENVTMGMKTLAHNLREQAFSKAFNCEGALGINLRTLIESFDPTEKLDK